MDPAAKVLYHLCNIFASLNINTWMHLLSFLVLIYTEVSAWEVMVFLWEMFLQGHWTIMRWLSVSLAALILHWKKSWKLALLLNFFSCCPAPCDKEWLGLVWLNFLGTSEIISWDDATVWFVVVAPDYMYIGFSYQWRYIRALVNLF